jgi:hypothetical protein
MTDLSPAAQEVLDAALFEVNAECDARRIAAAVLRAVADQVVPKRTAFLSPGTVAGIRAEILAIATELEGTN